MADETSNELEDPKVDTSEETSPPVTETEEGSTYMSGIAKAVLSGEWQPYPEPEPQPEEPPVEPMVGINDSKIGEFYVEIRTKGGELKYKGEFESVVVFDKYGVPAAKDYMIEDKFVRA